MISYNLLLILCFTLILFYCADYGACRTVKIVSRIMVRRCFIRIYGQVWKKGLTSIKETYKSVLFFSRGR